MSFLPLDSSSVKMLVLEGFLADATLFGRSKGGGIVDDDDCSS